jgi:hypothetical protein
MLVSRPFQLSDEPYADYLRSISVNVGVSSVCDNDTSEQSTRQTWWNTELHGWSGGESQSARTIDVTLRLSYSQGFAPVTDIPPERAVVPEDTQRLELVRYNSLGFVRLASWGDYYTLRGLSFSSPVALLLTFPLTLYHAIVEYGEVPCTVAQSSTCLTSFEKSCSCCPIQSHLS